MSHFILRAAEDTGSTSIPNLFLDHYMPKANGDYVKVYLYLQRALAAPPQKLSVAALADALECNEGDILRALKYWEKQGLLNLECDSSNTLQGIYLRRIPTGDPQEEPDRTKNVPEDSSVPARRSYSKNELQRFSQEAECKQLLFVCEQYMKKTLSPSEIETILYFYDGLHFSADLIEYLVEYCVCKGSYSIHYIEAVALAWAKAGVSTVAQAKERTTTFRRSTFSIMKAFGISDRNPVEPELAYTDRWLETYDLELILEACRRTMDALHKPSFQYADRILQKWSEQNVHTLKDVQALDQRHQQKSVRKKSISNARATGFTNFQQRDYDFDELEKQLLQSQNQ